MLPATAELQPHRTKDGALHRGQADRDRKGTVRLSRRGRPNTTTTQARDAGIQRLLTIAGYDAGPIDGVRGEKTDAALAQFITDNKLENTAAGRSDFFDQLMTAAQRPNSAGFAWCNETRIPRDGGARL